MATCAKGTSHSGAPTPHLGIPSPKTQTEDGEVCAGGAAADLVPDAGKQHCAVVQLQDTGEGHSQGLG